MSNIDNLTPFKKGHKKIEGDPEKAKAKRSLKALLNSFAEDNYEEFMEEFLKLKGKAKCDIYLKVLEYVRPKIASIQFDDVKEASTAAQLLKNFAEYKKETKED